jgi:hypothetical protein
MKSVQYISMIQNVTTCVAQKAFQLLESDLTPQVLAVGISTDLNNVQICVEPEDCSFEAKDFDSFHTLTARLSANTAPLSEADDPEERILLAKSEAFQSLASAKTDSNRRVTFFSNPFQVGEFTTFLALQLERHSYEEHRPLTRLTIDGANVFPSLIAGVAYEIFESQQRELQLLGPLRYLFSETDEQQLIRQAARKFMCTAAIAGQNEDGLHGLFERCDQLSTLPYEGKPGQGRIAIAPVGHPNIETVLPLADRVDMQDTRAIRKLLQLCGTDLLLLSDSAFVYGLGQVTGDYDSSREDLFVVRFRGHYQWELWHAGYCLMQVDFGKPRLPRLRPMDEVPLRAALSRVFAGVSNVHPMGSPG